MDFKYYSKQLAFSILGSLLCFSFLSFLTPISTYFDLLLISVVFFSLLSLLIYLIALNASKSKYKNFFLYVIMINVLFKIVASFVIIILYIQFKEPTDKLFILPFLSTYLVFILFETYFLSKVAESG